MTNEQHSKGVRAKLEKEYGRDNIYEFYSAMYDVINRGHTSHSDDNPYSLEAGEVIPFNLYKLGAQTAEKLRRLLKKRMIEIENR